MSPIFILGEEGAACLVGSALVGAGAGVLAATIIGAASKYKLAEDVTDLPVHAFLQKPYTAEVLLTTMQQVLCRKEAGGDAGA